MVAPLGEKASPLEKDQASGASKDWSLCPLELIQALLELLRNSGTTVPVSGARAGARTLDR